ncbi:MAG: ATP-binding protein [Pseudomonadota bacterium]
MDQLLNLLRDDRFMPHGHCYLWLPELLWTSVLSNAIIALAYLTIPVTLVYFIHKRRDLPFDWMFGAFGVFILACGSTHVLDIWTVWHPDYWLAAGVNVVTALASIVTAVLLVRLVPAALAIPSPGQLRRVNAELRETQAALLAAARRAGMAEVATNVLHNVGNVLNSVNVSAAVIGDQLRASRLAALDKVAQLLRANLDQPHFLSRDARGRMLPGYLDQLAQTLVAEQQQMLAELAHLSAAIDHIKEIVATQQSYAGAPAVLEPVALGALLDDALRMSADALRRHEVEVLREFDDVPPLLLDKHQLLQVLINLINNAKQAMAGAQGRRRRLVLRLAQAAPDAVRLQVCDNGQGIAPEQLERIFAHGFSTRAGGHGFGLHSCALAARAMGGQLSAHSDGAGSGATFTLELPVRAAAPAVAP